ncbi:MAG: RNA polymerase sigma factor SigZ [Flavobacteriales bacterium]|nr:RNA polymerase sigma factor SigZ [Flavobacteriales bacterium]
MDTTSIWSGFKIELLNFIRKRINDKEDANDILQEVFIKIHLQSDSFAEIKNLTGWLYQITRNAIIDYYRKRKITIDIKELTSDDQEEVNEKERQQFSKCLSSHLKELPEMYQDAFQKIEIDGLSQKEYAKELDISYSGAKSRFQRSKRQLKELFLACCKLETDKYGNILNSNLDQCNC